MIAPVVSFNWIEGWFCRHGRLYAISFETASRDTQTLNLSRNVTKFYARQVVSDDRAAKPKSNPLSTIRNNKFITQGEKLETVIAKVRDFVSNMSSPPLKRR